MQHQPTTHLAQELLMNAECCGSSSQGSGRPLEVDNDQLRGSLKLILLQLHEKLLKSSSIILWSFGVWSRLERWKTLISGCLMNWLQIKKNHHFEVSSSLIICNNSKLFHGLWYATKSGFYTTVNNQFSCWTKTKLQCTSQGQTCAKKKKGHSHCLAVCCFSDPLQLSESQRNHYVWEVCSKKQWDAPKTAMPSASIG